MKTRLALDHAERSMYRIAVAATDNGVPPKQTVRILRVEVLDVNDNRPTFSSSSLIFKVNERTFPLAPLRPFPLHQQNSSHIFALRAILADTRERTHRLRRRQRDRRRKSQPSESRPHNVHAELRGNVRGRRKAFRHRPPIRLVGGDSGAGPRTLLRVPARGAHFGHQLESAE